MKLLELLLMTAHALDTGNRQDSNKFLSRQKRKNGVWSEPLEWRNDGNYERECFEEVRT